MQLQNNNPSGLFKSRKHVVVLCVVIGLLFLVWLYFAIKSGQRGVGPGDYYDKGSKETVSNPPNRQAETYGTTKTDRPVYLGFSKLLDIGITSLQVEATREAFYRYSRAGQKNIKEVSIFVDTIRSVYKDRESTDTKRTATFDVKIDRKDTLKAKLEYFELRVVRLYLYDSKTNGTLFDSSDIDVYGDPNSGGD